MMKSGELIAIENPEAHLHPSLQLRLTETLVLHAATGRFVFVETQSDLVIRRVMRAILEENLAQRDVRVYFTDVDQSVELDEVRKLTFSRLNPIAIDARGRISNWPEGFLDDRTSASRNDCSTSCTEGSTRARTMNERRAEIAEQDLPEDGEVAYFVHLHLDTATKEGHHPGNPVIHVYRVEGKARTDACSSTIDEMPGRQTIVPGPADHVDWA